MKDINKKGEKLAKRGMISVMREFRRNPSLVWRKTIDDVIENMNTYKVTKKEAIQFFKDKIRELEK